MELEFNIIHIIEVIYHITFINIPFITVKGHNSSHTESYSDLVSYTHGMRTRHIKDSTLCIVACQTVANLSFKMIQLIKRNKMKMDSYICFQASPSPSISRSSHTKSLTHSLMEESFDPVGFRSLSPIPHMNPSCGAKMATGID